MVDIGQIQRRLNSDPRYRDAFLKDPIGVLLREGLVLPQEMQTSLRRQVAQLTQARRPITGPAVPAVQLGFSL